MSSFVLILICKMYIIIAVMLIELMYVLRVIWRLKSSRNRVRIFLYFDQTPNWLHSIDFVSIKRFKMLMVIELYSGDGAVIIISTCKIDCFDFTAFKYWCTACIPSTVAVITISVIFEFKLNVASNITKAFSKAPV